MIQYDYVKFKEVENVKSMTLFQKHAIKRERSRKEKSISKYIPLKSCHLKE